MSGMWSTQEYMSLSV